MKTALTVTREDINRLIPQIPLVETPDTEKVNLIAGNVDAFFDLQTQLIDREICEKNTETLQIIPYVALFDAASNKFLVYMRGEAGEENRLHGKCSIGFGGHIEEEVTADKPLTAVIADGIVRELQEEVGYTFSTDELNALPEVRDQLFFLYTNADEVGKVHLGLCAILMIDPSRLGQNEEGVITKSQWLDMNEIDSLVQSKDIELEQWSAMFVALLVNNARQAQEAANELQQAQGAVEETLAEVQGEQVGEVPDGIEAIESDALPTEEEVADVTQSILTGEQNIAAGEEVVAQDLSDIEAANATVQTPEHQAELAEAIQNYNPVETVVEDAALLDEGVETVTDPAPVATPAPGEVISQDYTQP